MRSLVRMEPVPSVGSASSQPTKGRNIVKTVLVVLIEVWIGGLDFPPWVLPLAILLGVLYLVWTWVPGSSRLRKWVRGGALVACFLVVLIASVVGLLGQKARSTSVTQPPKPAHTLLVKFSEGILPIRIAPKDTAYVLQLHPDVVKWAWEIQNQEDFAITWPSNIHPPPPGDRIYVCELTNHEDKAFLDVTVPFNVSFHHLEIVPVTVSRDKNGQVSVTLPRPGADHIVVTLGHPKYPEDLTAARDGELVKEFTHSIAVRSIASGSTVRIYLVNQSEWISKFTIPKQAKAVISGNPEPVPVALVRPDVTPMDEVPWFGLPPSTYDWKRLP